MKRYPYVKYRSGYKHLIEKDVTFIFSIRELHLPFSDPDKVGFIPIGELKIEPIDTRWIKVIVKDEQWYVTIKKGMGSDGTSAGLDKIKILRRGAFVHDGGYHLMKIDKCNHILRPVWDHIAYLIWIDSGVWKWVANACRKGLAIGGGAASLPENRRRIRIAR